MSILQIDVDPTLTYYDEIVPLESFEYIFEIAWSARESSYYLNIYDTDENQLAIGVKLLLNVDLLRRFPDPRIPPGKLLCLDATGTGQDISEPDDLGVNVLLMYVTSDDSSLTG